MSTKQIARSMVYVDEDTHRALKVLAAQRRQTIGALIRDLVAPEPRDDSGRAEQKAVQP
jgi:hypothetical protein